MIFNFLLWSVTIEFIIKVEIPNWLYHICLRVVLLYRRLHFGYAFRRIPLTQGKFAIVDPDDYHRLAKYKWRLCKTKGKNTLYAERSVRLPSGKYSRMLMHREVLSLSKGQIPEGFVIDHINRNGLDNRKANLRLATVAQNAQNSRKRNPRSGYKGVWLPKDKRKWRAAIWHNNKRIYLGSFDSPKKAARAYDNAAKKYHGAFASLNFDY